MQNVCNTQIALGNLETEFLFQFNININDAESVLELSQFPTGNISDGWTIQPLCLPAKVSV